MQAEGEDGGASAAASAGIPFSLSTMGTRSLEEVAAVSGAGRRWFQLYLWEDRDRSLDLLRRAETAGFDTLLITVDTPVAGQRLRDVRNGMTILPQLTLRTVLDASYRPEWWFNFLTTDPLTFASLSDTAADLPTIINSMFDPTLSIADLEWIRSVWPGQLFVKGVLTAEDTRRALALGADFVLIGRAYLYGLMAGGEQGVSRAIELLAREVESAMMLMGSATIADLKASGQVRAPWLDESGSSLQVTRNRT